MKKLISFLALFSCLVGQARTIVISDLDDTVRQANVLNYYDALKKIRKGVKPFNDLKNLFLELENDAHANNEDISFHYVSASFKFLYNAEEWLEENEFPYDSVTQRKPFQKKGKFKIETIESILNDLNITSEDRILFFGDNGEIDGEIYLEINENRDLNSEIYIRDIRLDSLNPSMSNEEKNLDGSEIRSFVNISSALEKSSLIKINSSLIENQVSDYSIEKLKEDIQEFCEEKSDCVSEHMQESTKVLEN